MHSFKVIKNDEVYNNDINEKKEQQRELINTYKNILPLKLAASTIPTYNTAMNNFIPWLEDNELFVWEVEPEDYDSFVQHLSNNVSKATIKNYNAHLSNFYDWLVSRKKKHIKKEFGINVVNPIDYFNTPRVTREENELPKLPDNEIVNYYFQKEKRELQIAKEEGNKRRVYIISRQMISEQIMLKAGLRVEEVSNLNINSIDFENMKIIVFKGKGCKDRIVEMTGGLAILLRWYIEQIYPLFNKKVSLFEDVPLLLSERKCRISKKTIQSKMWEQQEAFDIPIDQRFSPHGLRRLFATNLYKELYEEKHPDPIFYIKTQLGHTYISTTLKYCRIQQEFFANKRKMAIESISNTFKMQGE